jgi:ribosomal protein L37AE/L43A
MKTRPQTENEKVSRALMTLDWVEGDVEFWACANCGKQDVSRKVKGVWTNTKKDWPRDLRQKNRIPSMSTSTVISSLVLRLRLNDFGVLQGRSFLRTVPTCIPSRWRLCYS